MIDQRLGILRSRFQVKSVVPNEKILSIYPSCFNKCLETNKKTNAKFHIHLISSYVVQFFFFFFLSFKHYLQEKKIIDDRLEIKDNFNRYKNYFDIYILSSCLFNDAKKFAISFLKLYNDISVFLLSIHRYNLFICEK